MATGGQTKTVWQEQPKSYDYVKVKDILDVPEVYFPLAVLQTSYRELGVYEFKFSLHFKLGVTNKSVYYRFSLDGGATWHEFVSEAKDRTDSKGYTFMFPIEHTGGEFDFRFEIRKEDDTSELDVFQFAAMIERKG